MNRLAARLSNLRFDASLQVNCAGRRIMITACQRDISVEVPDVATGFAVLRSVLPRGLRSGFFKRVIVRSGLHFTLSVRRRVIVEVIGRTSGLFACLGYPHIRFRPISLLLAAISRRSY